VQTYDALEVEMQAYFTQTVQLDPADASRS